MVTTACAWELKATGLGQAGRHEWRDHIKSVHSFQKMLFARHHTYEEFLALVADYGRCVLCTCDENPARSAGYGNTYTVADILWLKGPVCTAREMSIKTTKARVALFKELLETDRATT